MGSDTNNNAPGARASTSGVRNGFSLPVNGSAHASLHTASGDVDVVDILTHEVTAPLAVLKVATETLRSRTELLDDAAREQILAVIDRQVENLADLTARLRHLRDLGRDDIERELGPIEIYELATSVVADLALLPDRAEVEVVDPGIEVLATGNTGSTRQILIQLLNNAQQHGNGQPVTVTFGANGGFMEVEVRDRGEGVSPARVEQLFAPYVRGETTKHPGLGIGLSLGRGLAQAQGGTLVHRVPETETGSAFVLSLPRAEDDTTPPAPTLR